MVSLDKLKSQDLEGCPLLSAGGSPQRPEFVKLCFQRPAGMEVVLIFYYKCFREKTAAVH